MEKLTKALMTDETGQAIVTKLTALSGQMHELAMATRGSAILFESESDISVLGDGGYLAVYVGTTNPLEISEWTGDNSLVTGHLYYLIKSGTDVASSDLGEYGGSAVTDTTLTLPNVPADSETVGLSLADKADADDVTALTTVVTGKADSADVTALDTRVTAVEGDIDALEAIAMLVDTISIPFTIFATGKGIKYSDGEPFTQSTLSYTDYIDIRKYGEISYKRLSFTGMSTAGMAFYDSEKTYISGKRCGVNMAETGYDQDLYNSPVPDNAVYARFTTFSDTQTYGEFALTGKSKLKTAIDTVSEDIADIETKKVTVRFEKGRYASSSAAERYYNSISETKKFMINSYPIIVSDASAVIFPAITLTDNTHFNVYFRDSSGANVSAPILTCATPNNRLNVPSGAYYMDIMIEYSGLYDLGITIEGGSEDVGQQTKRIYTNSNNEIVSYFEVDRPNDVYSACCYMLPPNYSSDGKKVPVILWFDGNMDYRTIASTFKPGKMPGLTYMRDEGFAVVQIYSWGSYFAEKYPTCGDDQPYPSPTCLKVLECGLRHFIDRYNVDTDNVNIVCKSMGGLISLYFASHPIHPFRSISMFSPIIDMFGLRGRYSDARRAIFEDNSFNGDIDDFADINTDGTTESGVENYYFSDRCLPLWNNNKGALARLNAAWVNLIGGTFAQNFSDSIADARAWYANKQATGLYDRGDYHKIACLPVKIWGAEHDTDVQYLAMVMAVEQLRNAGNFAELRSISSYDHSIFDASTAQAQDITTELGIFHEDVPIGWIESMEWIRTNMVKHSTETQEEVTE